MCRAKVVVLTLLPDIRLLASSGMSCTARGGMQDTSPTSGDSGSEVPPCGDDSVPPVGVDYTWDTAWTRDLLEVSLRDGQGVRSGMAGPLVPGGPV